MKLMFISDIHGSLHWLNRVLEKVKDEQPDQLILLGDYMYHGPRNPLPEQYNPAEVATALNKHKQHIIGIRGNCDSEVDQMLLEFPMMGDYVTLYANGRRIYATHGHGYSIDHLPYLMPGDIFIQGHTHVPVAGTKEQIYILNPGSIALPKDNYAHSYGILDDKAFTVKDFEGNSIKYIEFN